ncbi:hypothetical protein F5Y16DRAFT_147438 [Xylariaceae sp. FL0255]|nr:hypothetical protein F5Y16DRAFT_147438 [Xylariaceae sp. FL0255]
MWSFGTTFTIAKDGDAPAKSASQTSQPSQPEPEPIQQPISPPPNPISSPRPPITSERSLKQLGLFFGGAGFLALSTLITRRSVSKKLVATIPKFYHQSNRPVDKISSDSSLIALEALNLATLNVMGFAIMMTGGAAWAFDISSIEDLRAMARKQIHGPRGKTDEEAEQEIEEWVAKVLLRKEKKEQETNPNQKDS